MRVTVTIEMDDGTQRVLKGGGIMATIFEPERIEGDISEDFKDAQRSGLLGLGKLPTIYFVEGPMSLEVLRVSADTMATVVRQHEFKKRRGE